jgi:hypothetical protein
VLGLVALTLALTPGAVRVRVAAASLGAPEFASFALTCETGVWSIECLANLDELTRALANAPALVARVDSLATRQQFVFESGALRLRPLVAERPADPDDLRRLRARRGDPPRRGAGRAGRVRPRFAPSCDAASRRRRRQALVEPRWCFARRPGLRSRWSRARGARETAQTANELARLLPANSPRWRCWPLSAPSAR